MDNGTWFFILKLLAYVSICSIIAFLLGLFFGRPKSAQASVSSTASTQVEENARIKKLQEKLHLAEADSKTLRGELSELKAGSVAKSAHAALEDEMQALRNELNAEKKRYASLEADARKAQDTTASLNSRLNQESKLQQDRVISLENELSKARAELSASSAKPSDSSSELRAELERAKETAASATRLVGEARKREAALQQELDSCKKRLESAPAAASTQGLLSFSTSETSVKPAAPTPSPAAAKALEEVARLNAKREAEASQKAAAEQAAAEQAAAEQAAAEKAAAEQAAADKAAADKAAADKAAAEQAAAEQAAAEQAAAEQAAAEKAAAEKAAAEQAAASSQPKEKIQEASDVLGKRVVRDDLKIIEGIGPKIEELLHAAGILTWAQLSSSSEGALREILSKAGDAYTVHNPATWPRQAEMANEGRWMGLKAWQDVLDGGKEVSQ